MAPMPNIAPLNLLSAVVVLDRSLEGWTLLDPPSDDLSKSRVFMYPVTFDRPFAAPPIVQVGLVGLDASKDSNLRVRLRPVDITAAGFVVRAETWWDTRLWSIDVSWLAVGT